MKLIDLMNHKAILLGADFASPMEAIECLSRKLMETGKITCIDSFVQAVFEREVEGATALGEQLAVPHGKSDSVTTPCLAIATTKQNLMWEGVDQLEPVRIIVLLAIPLEHQGDTHIALLSELTQLLIDEDFRQSILKCSSSSDLVDLISVSA
ncbi:fructose PTS transporter subunit IIA [Vibrio mimicus]|uniref:fructose PTS transporter subunit IIA n=1 Tax=Vibrio mimicus TaxID=674 RepID=UPI0001BADC6F|nr:fructose PTS transporter subunit IIA [Vibrio mimicus]EEY36733.1 PTS fructose-specific enzyme IIA component-like protein [Vibrio mimicus MB451]